MNRCLQRAQASAAVVEAKYQAPGAAKWPSCQADKTM